MWTKTRSKTLVQVVMRVERNDRSSLVRVGDYRGGNLVLAGML